MLCPGGGSRSSSAAAAAAAAWSEGCWAETQRRRRRRRATTTTTRRRRRKSWARSRPQHREAGTLGVEEAAAAAAAAAIRSLRLGSGCDRRGLNPEGPCAPLAIRVPRAAEEAAAAARADGTRAPEERRLGAAMTFPLTPAPPNWPLRLSQSDRCSLLGLTLSSASAWLFNGWRPGLKLNFTGFLSKFSGWIGHQHLCNIGESIDYASSRSLASGDHVIPKKEHQRLERWLSS